MKHIRKQQRKLPGLTSLTKERRMELNPHHRKVMSKRKIVYLKENTMRKKLTEVSLRH
jgi:hypothetical protein